MTKILLIGADPDAVDYSDPSLPKGLTAEKIKAGIEAAKDDFGKRGWDADHCLIDPTDSPETIAVTVRAQLSSDSYDCVIIGGGIRLPPKMLLIFEAIVNAARTGAPAAAIAFNTHPEDSGDAAARWVSQGGGDTGR